jgi:hypothetical protein
LGKILVGLDKTNPYRYIIYLETNEGKSFTMGCDDKGFHDFIEKLKAQKHIAEMDRERMYELNESWV